LEQKRSYQGNENLGMALIKTGSSCAESFLKHECSNYSTDSVFLEKSCIPSTEGSTGDDDVDNSRAIVPVEKAEAAAGSITLLIRELPELRPGWPLLRRATLSDHKASDHHSAKQISVVKWAMQLPGRHYLLGADSKQSTCNEKGNQTSELDGESGAIVPIGPETVFASSYPSGSSRGLPEELEGLHEKYSATCRLFNYEELLQATSDFMPGLITSHFHFGKVFYKS